MAIKFFLMYAGGLLACSVLLFTVVKQFAAGFATGGKQPIIYGSLSSILASVAVYAATYISDNLFTVFWFFAGIFLLFGIVHMILVHNKYFTSGAEDSMKIFAGELLFAVSLVLFTILIFSTLQYFLKDKSFLFYPMMMSTLAFFLPVLFFQTFQSAYDIPPPVYSTWKYPVDQTIPLPDENPNEKLLVIGFEMSKKADELKNTYFRAKAPENLRLGDLFYFFINDYNELQSETPIEFTDRAGRPYEWWFRIKTKWYQGKKIIDPSLTVRDNDIRENTVIICERILQSS